MSKEIKGALLSAVISIILPAIITLIMTFIWGNQGEIIYSSILVKDKYVNNITVKNMQKNEYLNNFNLLINEEIEIKDNTIFINGENYTIEKNTIELKKIKPTEVINISFETNNVINDKSLFVIKSQKRIGIENFNKKENLNVYWFILLACYGFINFIAYLINNIKANKRYDNYNKTLEHVEKQNDICEKRIKELLRKENINKTIYVKEMNDMEKELKFYQQIILKSINEKMTKSELDALISKNLKTFNKNKIKHLSYNDLYKIVYGLVETFENDNKNKEE